MSEIRGKVKNLKTVQTDSGPRLIFSMMIAEGRDVPAVYSTAENLAAGEEIVAVGQYDNEGTLVVQAIRRNVVPPAPPEPGSALGNLRPVRMILSGLLGDLVGFVPTLILISLFHLRATFTGKMSGPVLFLYSASSIGCALLLGLIFAGKRRKTNLYIAAIAALALPIVFLLK
jgi:hypothetical protein